jgi:S1-C subfamily serine protease
VPSPVHAGEVAAVGCNGLTAAGGALRWDGDRWVTAAHLVRSVSDVEVTAGGERWPATVVAVDERTDLAVLSVPGAGSAPSPRSAAADAGGPAELLGPDGSRSVHVLDEVRVRVRSADGATREWQGVTIDGVVRSGDSGWPLVQDGPAVGVVVLADADRDAGFAVAMDEVVAFVDREHEQVVDHGCPTDD